MTLCPKQYFQEYLACLALTHTEGLGSRTWKKLLDFYGSANRAIQDRDNWVKHTLVRKQVAQKFSQEHWRIHAQQEWEQIQNNPSIQIIVSIDPRYPDRLRQLADPPLYLYAQGNPGLMKRPCLAVVGSRMCSRYGLDIAASISHDLSLAGITIVSGFAIGIDSQAHKKAMEGQGKSIAVMGTGPDLIYPSRNQQLWKEMSQSGLLITEFSPGTQPEPRNFPRRNRIISGISLGILVIEATKNSGSLITARLALEQNREVFAIPGPLNAPSYTGCNALIRQGAFLVRSAEDILQELKPVLACEWETNQTHQSHSGQTVRAPKDMPKHHETLPIPPDLDPEERDLLKIMQDSPKIHIDTLTQLMGRESSYVSQILVKLEIKGLVKQLSGMYYTHCTNPTTEDRS